MMLRPLLRRTVAASALASGAYLGLVTGALTLDLGVGRRVRPLGPITLHYAAPPEVVFDLIHAPYAERATRAMQEKVRVLHRGQDMVLAAHRTPLPRGLTATTVETVRFVRPERFEFRLVRGPVPHVTETFELRAEDGGTVLTYTGELGTDFGPVGARWGDLVAGSWEAAVRRSLEMVRTEVERPHRRS